MGAGTLVCLTVAFKHLPSGIALSIFYTNPILAVLVARIILGERVTRAAVIALILAVIGAMLVTNNPSSTSSSPSVGDNTTYGLLLAFCGALFGAFIPLHTRILMTDYRNHNDNSEDLCFMLPSLSVGIVGTCIGLVLRGYVSPQSLIGDGVANMIWKMMPGTLVLLAQSMIGKGFQLCDAGTGAIMMTMELPMAFAIQTIVLGERSSMGCSIGALLLLMSAVTVAVSKVFVETLE